MKTTKLFLLLVLFLGLLISCGNNQQKSNLKVSFGAITGSANFPGGLYLLARNNSNGEEFIEQVPPGDTLELELNNGLWDFGVIGWDSSTNAYEGQTFCGHQKTDLTGGDFFVNILATPENCAAFTDPLALASATTLTSLKFYSCMDLKRHFDLGERIDVVEDRNNDGDYLDQDEYFDCQGGGDGGGVGPGGDQSFRISILTKSPTGTLGTGLVSTCVNGPGNLSNIKFPMSNANIKIPVQVRAYAGSGCTGAETKYNFHEGLHVNGLNNTSQAIADRNLTTNVYLHVNKCSGAQLTAQPYAATYGAGTSHLICTADQFVNIGAAGTTYHEFELGQDIDFSLLTSSSVGTYAYVANDYGGDFRGNFKKVKNGNRALFNHIIEHNTDRNYIANVIIDNFDINFAGSSGQSFGIFANKISNYGTQDVEVGSIYILDTSSLNITGNVGGYIGAVAGLVDHGTNSAYTFVRRAQSLAPVMSNNTTETTQYVGGLIGKAMGTSGNNGGGLALELCDIGKIELPAINYDGNTTSAINLSGSVQVSGYKNVGGIVGSIYNAELRGPITADTTITSYGDSGGVVGSVSIGTSNNYMNLAALKSKLVFTPAISAVSGIGGIVGDVYQTASGSSFLLHSNVADLTINDNGNEVNMVGGIMGSYYTTNHGEAKVVNSKANVNIMANGSYQGGLIGNYNAANPQQGIMNDIPAVTASIAQGVIGDSTATGHYKGGLVGYGADADVFRSVSNIDIYGNGRLGGAIGKAQDSLVWESYIDGLVEATGSSTLSLYVGGVTGELANSVNSFDSFFAIGKVDTDINIPAVSVTNCSTAKCGLVVGGLESSMSSPLSFYSIAVGSIDDLGGAITSASTLYCGAQYSGVCPDFLGGYPVDLGSKSADTSSECAHFSSSGQPFDLDGSICTPLFEKQWKKYGHDTSVTDYEYIAGNVIEPFDISSITDWNGLSDDSFLMSKAFQLTNDLNFGGNPANINSIGSTHEPFNGVLFSNGYKLVDVAYNATNDKPGVIAATSKGVGIGNREKAFEVAGFNLNCGSQSRCGFIGEVGNPSGSSFGGGDSAINLKISGSSITGSSNNDCTGGFIGKAFSRIRIEKSSFQGSIDVVGNGVGGFVGCVSPNANSGSSDHGLNIEESFVDLTYISGTNYVGGFLGIDQGAFSSHTFFDVRDSYVVFDKNNTHSGNDINATSGSYVSGLIGGIDLTKSNSYEVDTTYVDTSTAQIPSDYTPFARSISGSTDANDDFYDIALIWNANASAHTFYLANAGAAPNYTDYMEYSAQSLSNSSSTDSFRYYAEDGHNDWYFPDGSRVLMLDWQDPNYQGW